MLREKYFVKPPRDFYVGGSASDYAGKYFSYANYNYLRPGLISRIKRSRFETAMRLTESLLDRGVDAIDFGSADGVFLPTLSHHFRKVVAIDASERFVGMAQRLVEGLELKNVQTICNEGMSFEQLKTHLPEGDYKVVYLLETLEHIGPKGCQGEGLYEAKVEFLNGIFSLVPKDAVIVVSVPRMVGLPFFIKQMTQVALRLPREAFTFREMVDASIWKNTDELQKRWDGSHAGFNHLKLEEHLGRAFVVERRQTSFTTAFYVLRPMKG